MARASYFCQILFNRFIEINKIKYLSTVLISLDYVINQGFCIDDKRVTKIGRYLTVSLSLCTNKL